MDQSNDCIGKRKTDYFVAISAKVARSQNTLKNLDLSILKNSEKKVSEDKSTIKRSLIDYYEKESFPKIHSLLINNFNVILYGLGSKKNLLDSFKNKWLSHEKFLCISGFFVNLNLKIVLIKLSKLFDLENETTDKNDLLIQVSELKNDIYLIIHSIEILFKTDPEIKKFLINLYEKSNGKLHIIGTVDHANAALLFDLKENQKLNLVCLETTTYENFDLERGFISSANSKKNNKSLMNLDQQTLTINSIINVYHNLPHNTRKVMLIIFKEWIEHQEFIKMIKKSILKDTNDGSKGLEYDLIFQKCKEEFLCNTRPAFKQQLDEFKDHDLIKKVRSDGNDYLTILIENDIIKKFLNEIENSNDHN